MKVKREKEKVKGKRQKRDRLELDLSGSLLAYGYVSRPSEGKSSLL